MTFWQGFSKSANEIIEGGLADGMPDSKYDKDELAKGIKVEMEHTGDYAAAKEIAKDHLQEIPDYYTRLAKMENEAEKKAMDPIIQKAVSKVMSDKYEVHDVIKELPPEKRDDLLKALREHGSEKNAFWQGFSKQANLATAAGKAVRKPWSKNITDAVNKQYKATRKIKEGPTLDYSSWLKPKPDMSGAKTIDYRNL